MIRSLKRKITGTILVGIILLGCAGVATTTALISTGINTSVAYADAWKSSKGGWWYQIGTNYAKGWKQISGTWYYFDNNGWMKTGWQSIGGKWYYFNGGGAMVTGWNKVGGAWYYHTSSGAMTTGWNRVNSTWYYHNNSGAMLIGWQYIGSKWYYFNGSGAMLADQWIGNYYVKSDGSMATNQWIGDYYVDGNGKWDSSKKPTINNEGNNKPNNSVNSGPGSVIDGKFYDYNGNQVIFSGKYSGECTYTDGWTDEGLNCLGAKDKRLTIDFKKYDPISNTYTVDITFLAHFHKRYPNPILASATDEMVTISDLEVSQNSILRGNGIWSDTACSKTNSDLTALIDIGCWDFDPSTRTIRISLNNTFWIPNDQAESYTVKLI